jgi:hypothetical protein
MAWDTQGHKQKVLVKDDSTGQQLSNDTYAEETTVAKETTNSM